MEPASFWRGRRAFVTGCMSFLGAAVVRELLAQRAEVVGLIPEYSAASFFSAEEMRHIHFVHGRTDSVFRLHSAMAIHEVIAVFHLDSQDSASRAMREAVSLYSRRVPVVVTDSLPQLGIARTEEASEERFTVARFGEVFGPGDTNRSRIVPTIMQGTTPAGDGPARDFVFVRDAARACLLAAEAAFTSGPADFSFRSGWLMTERRMAEAVRAASDSREVAVPDSAPLANPLGWRPAHSFGESLNETLAWYREFLKSHSATIRAAA